MTANSTATAAEYATSGTHTPVQMVSVIEGGSMGRLIYADRLLEGTEDHQFIDTHVIWNAPTVDAIPVEWMLKFRNDLDNLSENRLMFAIDTVIEAWKAEQRKEE